MLVFQTGVGDMLPAVEEALTPMLPGEARQIVVPPDKAYGPITSRAHREFPLQAIPEKARQIGRKVMAAAPDGKETLVEVIDIRDSTVVLDFNHPLAGETLVFDLQVISNEQLK